MTNKTFSVLAILLAGMGSLYSQSPVLQQGVSVQMPVARNATEARAADDQNAVIIAVTSDGKVFTGAEQAQPATLSRLKASTVYVKADARVPYQSVLTVLDALHGKTVILLSASPKSAAKQGYLPPFGTALTLPR